MKSVLIGIDAGSTNIKVCSFLPDGQMICSVSQKTPTHTGSSKIRDDTKKNVGGGISKDAYVQESGTYFETREIWDILVVLLRKTMSELSNSGYKPEALAVTGMGESYVGLYESGFDEQITTWFDRRSSSCIPLLKEYERQNGKKDGIFIETGMEATGIFTLPKLLYAREKDPETFEKLKTVLSVPGYITYRLCGEKVFDHSLACRTMLYSLNDKTWSKKLINSFQLPEHIFPPLVAPGQFIGKIQSSVAHETELPDDLLICSGGHDHFCGSFGAGLLKGGRIVDSSGTAESIHGITTTKSNPFSSFEGFRVGRYVDEDHLYIVGGITSSGATYEWAANQFASGRSLDALDAELTNLNLKAEDLAELPLFLPHLRGSGAPFWDENSMGAYYGIDEKCMGRQFLLSAIEGLSFEFASVIKKLLNTLSTPVSSVTVTGGGSRNIFWQKLKASSLGLPLEITDVSECTAFGAALLAGIGSGVFSDYRQASSSAGKVRRIVEPQKEWTTLLTERLNLFQKLYAQSIDIHTALKKSKKTYSV